MIDHIGTINLFQHQYPGHLMRKGKIAEFPAQIAAADNLFAWSQ